MMLRQVLAPYHTPPRSTGGSDENGKDADDVLGNDIQDSVNEQSLAQAENRSWAVSAHGKDAIISKGSGPISLAALANLEVELQKSDH